MQLQIALIKNMISYSELSAYDDNNTFMYKFTSQIILTLSMRKYEAQWRFTQGNGANK